MRKCRTFLKADVSSYARVVCHGVKLLRRLTGRRVVLLDLPLDWPIGVKPSGLIYRQHCKRWNSLAATVKVRLTSLTHLNRFVSFTHRGTHKRPNPSLRQPLLYFFSLSLPHALSFIPFPCFLSRSLSFYIYDPGDNFVEHLYFILILFLLDALQISIFLLSFSTNRYCLYFYIFNWSQFLIIHY